MSRSILLRNQKGIATTEFVLVLTSFVAILAALLLNSRLVQTKIESLVSVRNLVWKESARVQIANESKDVILASEMPDLMMDRCLIPILSRKPVRIRGEIRNEPESSYLDLFPKSGFTDHFEIAIDSWKDLSPEEFMAVLAQCQG